MHNMNYLRGILPGLWPLCTFPPEERTTTKTEVSIAPSLRGRPLPPLSLPWVPVSCPQRCHCGAHEDRLAQRLANTGDQLGPGQGRLKQSNTLYCYPFLCKQLHTLACGIDNLAAEISEGVEGDSCVSCRPVKLPRRLLV